MKALKLVAKIIVWTVVVVVVALLALPLWIGPVGKGIANAVVPDITGTGFSLGEFGLNQYSGTMHVGDMQLANPKGFKEKNAVELTKFDADFAMTSLVFGKKYRVESVVLDGLVVYSDASASNFRQIAANASGEKKEGGEKAESPDAAKMPKAKPGETASKPEKKGRGFQIDRLVVDNVTLKIGIVPIKVPTKIVIEGIGAGSDDGASLQEVVEAVYAKILSVAGAVGGKIGDIGKGAVDAVRNVDLGAAAGAIGSGSVEGAKDALKGVGKGIKDAVKVDGAKDALKEAGNNLKSLFK